MAAVTQQLKTSSYPSTRDGADIAGVDVKEDKMKAVADEAGALGRKATTFKADVSNRDDVYSAVDHTEKELGGFDIIVNNAPR